MWWRDTARDTGMVNGLTASRGRWPERTVAGRGPFGPTQDEPRERLLELGGGTDGHPDHDTRTQR
jgi:hypothetical protein